MFKLLTSFVLRLFGFPSPKEDSVESPQYKLVAIFSKSIDDSVKLISELNYPKGKCVRMDTMFPNLVAGSVEMAARASIVEQNSIASLKERTEHVYLVAGGDYPFNHVDGHWWFEATGCEVFIIERDSRIFDFNAKTYKPFLHSLFRRQPLDATIPGRVMFAAVRFGCSTTETNYLALGLCRDDGFMLKTYNDIVDQGVAVNDHEYGFIDSNREFITEDEALRYDFPEFGFFPAAYAGKPIREAKRMVVGAAVKFDDTIVIGIRHYDDFMQDVLDLPTNSDRFDIAMLLNGVTEGFVDQYGNFMDRKEAYLVVHQSGQPFYQWRNKSNEELYSEGVW